MSYESGPGPVDPSAPGGAGGYPGQPGQPYGGPAVPYGAAPTGPYGAGPGGPTGPYGPYGVPGGQPPRKGRGGLIAGLIIGGVVVVIVAVFGAVVLLRSSGGGGNDLDALPSPKTLGHDPVPAEKKITARPADCGISPATIKALTPGATNEGSGDDCTWSSFSFSQSKDLEVRYEPVESAYEQTSPVAAAIDKFTEDTAPDSPLADGTYKPLKGLGDEAAYTAGPGTGGSGVEGDVVFRAADQVVTVQYGSIEAKTAATGKFKSGAFRAASELAKKLGVPASPVEAPAAQVAPVTVPDDVCGLLPKDLVQKLGGEKNPTSTSDDDDSLINALSTSGLNTSGCRVSATGDGTKLQSRSLEVHITSSQKPGGGTVIANTYLAAYYEARAERPTAGNARYFQALSGLGDQAFCSYLAGHRAQAALEKDAATIVIRHGTALITVVFGGDIGDSGLNEQQTIKGAYAMAVKVAAQVK